MVAELLKYYTFQEKDFLPWQMLLSRISKLVIVKRRPLYQLFNSSSDAGKVWRLFNSSSDAGKVWRLFNSSKRFGVCLTRLVMLKRFGVQIYQVFDFCSRIIVFEAQIMHPHVNQASLSLLA